jgi:hypothetical protein
MLPQANDRLARFKQIQRHGKSADPVGFDAEHHPTFWAADGNSHERLRIKLHMGIIHAPLYRYLMDVRCNEEGTQMNLYFSFLRVRIRGKNLHPLAQAIEDGTCTLIHDSHPDENYHPSPTDTVIDEIAVKAAYGDDDLASED